MTGTGASAQAASARAQAAADSQETGGLFRCAAARGKAGKTVAGHVGSFPRDVHPGSGAKKNPQSFSVSGRPWNGVGRSAPRSPAVPAPENLDAEGGVHESIYGLDDSTIVASCKRLFRPPRGFFAGDRSAIFLLAFLPAASGLHKCIGNVLAGDFGDNTHGVGRKSHGPETKLLHCELRTVSRSTQPILLNRLA